eukprot:CAMPEP_0172485466 /NCGR_PEP_ID=MMETSP1066-20121228/13504_1 /TAXON_ID=671091 /ORGANISM="Coscinodiscus wailesii, Strain CCMP2513" /LENGTH=537 /DNA_ID=CAMNT_0013250749 /DNA_START=62 /DNA_END=1675 /DNA_ORIENTATION=-
MTDSSFTRLSRYLVYVGVLSNPTACNEYHRTRANYDPPPVSGLVASNDPLPFSFDIDRVAESITLYNRSHLVGVNYTTSNRPYNLTLYENDCKTPVNSYVTKDAISSVDSTNPGFIDLYATVNVDHDIIRSEYWDWVKDNVDGKYIFCVDLQLFADDAMTTSVNFHQSKFSMFYNENATFEETFAFQASVGDLSEATANSIIKFAAEALEWFYVTNRGAVVFRDAIYEAYDEMDESNFNWTTMIYKINDVFVNAPFSRRLENGAGDDNSLQVELSYVWKHHCETSDCTDESLYAVFNEIKAEVLAKDEKLAKMIEDKLKERNIDLPGMVLTERVWGNPVPIIRAASELSNVEVSADYHNVGYDSVGYGSVDYDDYVNIYQCNEELQSVGHDHVLNQGDLLHVCAGIKDGVSSAVSVQQIVDLTIEYSEGSTTFNAITDGYVNNLLVSASCHGQKNICHAKVQLINAFFEDSKPKLVTVSGTVSALDNVATEHKGRGEFRLNLGLPNDEVIHDRSRGPRRGMILAFVLAIIGGMLMYD